jgi:hypothetical protein
MARENKEIKNASRDGYGRFSLEVNLPVCPQLSGQLTTYSRSNLSVSDFSGSENINHHSCGEDLICVYGNVLRET